MFQAFNYKVIELKRIKFNNLKLPNSLKLGSYIVIKKERFDWLSIISQIVNILNIQCRLF
ncbi:hypothetical protein [Mycoplasmopsis cynos]|uniref:hypothetical protein n=1 Tax=Mycoplasmopsis cynos TaxID=171284 RepID=UPI0024CA2E03|nr:hypothetical protein [Mycoplasmopsis cynos]WAM07461.1 hypothetical protein ONA21_04815 [Mycoplasmopsis cynos]